MSERKVLNKYYPYDYDPSKIPRAKRPKNRQWTIRTMAPFNMRCNTCGEYIYKGKKFNSRQEVAEGEQYLTLKIFRFYIKCPKCVSEITFKTDPQSMDYVLEAGATRNFEALRTAELMAQKEAAEKEAELENNPMKMLENRTKQSQREMDMIETLEDIRELNSRHQKVDMNELIEKKVIQQKLYEEKLKQLQEDEDEEFVQSIFGKDGDRVVRRLDDSDGSAASDDDGDQPTPSKLRRLAHPTDLLVQDDAAQPSGSGSPAVNDSPSASSAASSSSAKSSSASSTSYSQPKKDSLKITIGSSIVKQPKKTNLGLLVKKKAPTKSSSDSVKPAFSKPSLYELVKQKDNAVKSSIKQQESGNVKDCKSDSVSACSSDSAKGATKESNSKPNALSLLGGYSDSEGSSENE